MGYGLPEKKNDSKKIKNQTKKKTGLSLQKKKKHKEKGHNSTKQRVGKNETIRRVECTSNKQHKSTWNQMMAGERSYTSTYK